MRAFMDEDFLLSNPTAVKLYHNYAENMPIIDYHCHIPPKDIAEDRRFQNITQALMGGGNYGDHYIWRLMRACGIPEKEVTGETDDHLRFRRLAETMSKCIGNPVYQWLHLELKRYFGYDKPLSSETAEDAWNHCNSVLARPEMSVRSLIEQCRVDVIVTTDDPIDDLRWHRQLMEDGSFHTRVLPAMRPDRVLNLDKPGFAAYIETLSKISGVEIGSIADLKEAMRRRMDFFAGMGCGITDHGLDFIPWKPADADTAERIFRDALNGGSVNAQDAEIYKTAIMRFLGREYAQRGWVMQLHYGARRNNNSRMYREKGPDTGFDAISDRSSAEALALYLDDLDREQTLPKTILYSLNPNDNAMLTTMMGCFQEGYKDAGHVQHGSAWWFNDTKAGMEAQLTNLAAESVLGNFVGMLTDSRSFFSYARHEYFRRILCNLLGTWVENGEYPADWSMLGELVQNVCYYNAKRYFSL